MTDQVTTTETTEVKEPVPGSDEYNAAMAEKGRAAREHLDPAAKPEVPQKPDNVPEKFWDKERGAVNTEALLQSYSELEKKQGEKPAEKTEEAPSLENKEAQQVAEKAGLDWNVLNTKVAEKGDLEEADYAAFEKAGIPKDIVKRHIELEKFRVETERATAVQYIGGQDETEKLLGWAAQNLSEADKVEYNKMLAGPQWKVAVDALKSKRAGSSKTAGEPSLEGGNSAGGAKAVGYKDREEMRADMRDPRYFDTSPKGAQYRAEVARKASLSPWNVNVR